VRDATRVRELLNANNIPIAGMILNRFRRKLARRGDIMDVDDAVDILSMELLGVVPEDEAVVRLGNIGEPLSQEKTPAALAFRQIARKVAGAETKEEGRFAGIMHGIFGSGAHGRQKTT